MKKTYLKPTMQAVLLQHQHQLLADSLRVVKTNLSEEDDLKIEETYEPSWGR
jgi:hypothetical protein